MRFAAFTLSTLVASAAAGVIVTKDNIDYSGVDWKNVDYSNVDWTKIDYSGGGNNNNNDNKKTNDQTTQTNQNTVDNTVVVPQKQQKEPEKAPEPSAAPIPSEIPAVPISVPTTLSTKIATSTSSVAAPAKTSEVAQTKTTTSNGDLSGDKQNALAAHNAARKDVKTDPLIWDDSLANDAQAYANTIAALGSLTHSSGSGQGENLYMQSGSDAPLLNAINSFLGEKSLYGGQGIDGDFAKYGHYTQAVWKSTTKVGMAFAKGPDGNTYVVARYSPPGNFMGEKAY